MIGVNESCEGSVAIMGMTQSQKYRIVIYILVTGLLTFIVLEFLPVSLSLQNFGMKGVYRDGRLVVQYINTASPAHVADLRVGDAIIDIDGRPLEEWQRLHQTQLQEYIALRGT